MTTSKFAKIVMGAVLLAGVVVQAQAQDKPVDPSGTYMWTQPGRNGGPDRTNTLVLKVDAGVLTGSVTSPGRGGAAPTPTAISDGKVTGADISFSVVRTFNDNSMTNTYTGTVADGTIKGKIEMNRNGDVQSRDWNATLQK
jgi:hypothetical protein